MFSANLWLEDALRSDAVLRESWLWLHKRWKPLKAIEAQRRSKMINLEDFHEDILGKAMRGLGVGKNEMAARTNMERNQIESVLSGQVNEELIRLMALQLQLDPEKLICSAPRNGVHLL